MSAAREAVAEALAALQDRDLGAAEECLDRALNLLAEEETPLPNHVRLGYSFPASREAVETLLNMPICDGRSEWRWFNLSNGDVALGFFPQSDGQDGYFGTEVIREQDWVGAQSSGRLQNLTMTRAGFEEAQGSTSTERLAVVRRLCDLPENEFPEHRLQIIETPTGQVTVGVDGLLAYVINHDDTVEEIG